jgi:hypothetical protein
MHPSGAFGEASVKRRESVGEASVVVSAPNVASLLASTLKRLVSQPQGRTFSPNSGAKNGDISVIPPTRVLKPRTFRAAADRFGQTARTTTKSAQTDVISPSAE